MVTSSENFLALYFPAHLQNNFQFKIFIQKFFYKIVLVSKKLLVAQFDKRLTFIYHISELCKKTSKKLMKLQESVNT